MTTARDLMTSPVETLTTTQTLVEAAEALASADVGSMPVLEGDKLFGVLTDRDIVVNGLAKGKDASTTTVGEIATDRVVTVSVDDDAEAVAKVLAEHQVRRVPVLDNDRLVGVVAQADVARALDKSTVGSVVEDISRN